LCCLSRTNKCEERQHAKRESQERDREAQRLDELVSQKRREEVVKKWCNERLGVPGQKQLDARETRSGGIADVGNEELPIYQSVVAAGRFVPRVGARTDKF
jgi:hypothetical protein